MEKWQKTGLSSNRKELLYAHIFMFCSWKPDMGHWDVLKGCDAMMQWKVTCFLASIHKL
jgi:hypothetical protein